ncbi:hypothetical protein [Amycolatopsis alkalitolerans]|uniref:hypothetical protein n=1 Tax=Amycolatopsis alkalitolerans TaxID=2547244 RepID=UPI00190F507D|nr:hypothetical protein [Amycolatopsis alkalitolerans]
MDEVGLRRFRSEFFRAYGSGCQNAPIELARHLVFGAVEYARGLDFEPHRDFGDVAAHLGAWEGPSAITFGRDGKPFYTSGPHDNPAQVVKKLQRAVGREFDYIVADGSGLLLP